MNGADATRFHQLYGIKKPRLAYYDKDFIDYALMVAISGAVIFSSYGREHWMAMLGLALCVFMVVTFPLRHGLGFRVPVLLQRPQEILYLALYKLRNTKAVFPIGAAVLVLENVFIYLTPELPHHVELMRTIGMYLLYIHFLGITAYRTVSLIAHLRKREMVKEFLLQTTWKKYLEKQPSITLQLVHAYFTGLLTHIVLIAPWYLVIKFASFSVLALPITAVLNVIVQVQFFRTLNAWFYRDHWLGHNSEFEFLYLHGTHHDAIPCGLIGVAGNGFLEGFLRYSIAFPTQFLNPIVAFVFFTMSVKQDIDTHQYVPCVFPRQHRPFHEVTQHSTHHYGRLEPYGLGVKSDQPEISAAGWKVIRAFPKPLQNTAELDEQLNGFKWDNAAYRKFLELFSRYQPPDRRTP
jgi:hypothetical protein